MFAVGFEGLCLTATNAHKLPLTVLEGSGMSMTTVVVVTVAVTVVLTAAHGAEATVPQRMLGEETRVEARLEVRLEAMPLRRTHGYDTESCPQTTNRGRNQDQSVRSDPASTSRPGLSLSQRNTSPSHKWQPQNPKKRKSGKSGRSERSRKLTHSAMPSPWISKRNKDLLLMDMRLKQKSGLIPLLK